jgi:hypothetical protein
MPPEDDKSKDPWRDFQAVFAPTTPPLPEKTSVAEDVLITFGIPFSGKGGGSLKNVDIKRADAFSSLKASLLETYANEEDSKLLEIRINEDGVAEFYNVGSDSGSFNPYYTINSSNYVKPSVGVSVTGAKPKQERIVYDWYRLIDPSAPEGAVNNSSVHDTTYLNSGCTYTNFSTTAVVTYRDPFRHGTEKNWNNGIVDIFELISPFERFIGFSWKIVPPKELVTPFTKIYQQSQSSIPVLLTKPETGIGNKKVPPDIGKLIRRKTILNTDVGILECFSFENDYKYCSTSAINIDLSGLKEGLTYETVRKTTVSKFQGVGSVFIRGIPLERCVGVPKDDAAAIQENKAENTVLCAFSQNIYTNIIRLNESIHYALLYKKEEEDKNAVISLPCIQFINNLRYNDYAAAGTGVQFYIDYLAHDLLALYDNADPAIGTILPLEQRNGVLVDQVWAEIMLDTPCFVVSDPTQKKASEIAKNLRVDVTALAVRDLPSPIAINGELIDQVTGYKVDNDPTTHDQDFQESPMEKAMALMSSGRTLSLSMSSLDEASTVRLSQKLYGLLSKDTGSTYTHTCPPTDKPKIGGRGIKNGIINVIEYSYTDQGSYLINVTEGPEYFGDFTGIDGGVYYKQTEEVSNVKGTVVRDEGNHVNFTVHVDGIGPISCINTCASIVTVRDRVSVVIHNNAVEK